MNDKAVTTISYPIEMPACGPGMWGGKEAQLKLMVCLVPY